jgi:endonuclease/exonuclease/phosphatase family metal-dependent hydrolase
MSFNIRYGTAQDGPNAWPLRRELVFQTIRDQAPDVVGIQEALAFQLDELDEALPRYRRVGVGRDDGEAAGEFAAVLFDRDRYRVLDEGTFWFSDTPSVPGSMDWGNGITRICTWVRLRDHQTGRSFFVYNVHWDHESQVSRERSAVLLVERIRTRAGQDDPVIVTGDFNAGESNPAFTYLLSHGLIDTFREAHPTATSVGTFNAFRGVSDGDKIDAVLVSNGWDVIDAGIVGSNDDGRYPSDHFPVVAQLTAP